MDTHFSKKFLIKGGLSYAVYGNPIGYPNENDKLDFNKTFNL